jgi:3,4-dihydroxy 2-butanone 4-phosphate synthase / GTP cyclohydrolase II
MPRITVEQAIEEIAAGRMVILVDDEDRENEGDLTMAAEKVTPKPSISWPNTAAG